MDQERSGELLGALVGGGKTTQREVKDVAALLGTSRLAGVILNKYRGGLISEGYGFDSYYAAGYGKAEPDSE